MEETNLFEELVEIGGEDISVTLNSPTKLLKTRINIVGRGPIDKKILWKILKLVDKRQAQLKLLSYGVLEITF